MEWTPSRPPNFYEPLRRAPMMAGQYADPSLVLELPIPKPSGHFYNGLTTARFYQQLRVNPRKAIHFEAAATRGAAGAKAQGPKSMGRAATAMVRTVVSSYPVASGRSAGPANYSGNRKKLDFD